MRTICSPRLVDRGAWHPPAPSTRRSSPSRWPALTDAALTRAVDLGCEHADIRVERIHTQTVSLRDARPESFTDGEDLGLAVRVVHEGTWGFAAGVVLTAAEAVRLAEEAVAVAKVSAAINSDRVELAPEPVYADATWVSDYEIDPFERARQREERAAHRAVRAADGRRRRRARADAAACT